MTEDISDSKQRPFRHYREEYYVTFSSERVAVVIVNWNSSDLLDRCLAALSQQTLSASHIVVVDNASDDGSAARVEMRYEKVRVIRLDRNTGFAKANNIGIAETEDCDWVALLNPDAFAQPDWLEQLVAVAKSRSEYSCFGSRLIQAHDHAKLDGVGDIYHVSGAHWRRGHGTTQKGRYVEPQEIFAPCAAAALYRRDALLQVGGFDDSFFCYAEDIDLGFRLRLSGHRCLYVPDAVVFHVGSAITGRRSNFTVYHGHRNLVWVFFKNMPGLLLTLYLPQHLLLNLMSILWFTLRGKGGVIFRAKWDAVKGLRRIWDERKKTQEARKVSARELRRWMATGIWAPYSQCMRRRA